MQTRFNHQIFKNRWWTRMCKIIKMLWQLEKPKRWKQMYKSCWRKALIVSISMSRLLRACLTVGDLILESIRFWTILMLLAPTFSSERRSTARTRRLPGLALNYRGTRPSWGTRRVRACLMNSRESWILALPMTAQVRRRRRGLAMGSQRVRRVHLMRGECCPWLDPRRNRKLIRK